MFLVRIDHWCHDVFNFSDILFILVNDMLWNLASQPLVNMRLSVNWKAFTELSKTELSCKKDFGFISRWKKHVSSPGVQGISLMIIVERGPSIRRGLNLVSSQTWKKNPVSWIRSAALGNLIKRRNIPKMAKSDDWLMFKQTGIWLEVAQFFCWMSKHLASHRFYS